MEYTALANKRANGGAQFLIRKAVTFLESLMNDGNLKL